ncbi:hypothetical protein ACG3SL_12755 [Sphingomonas sp. CJ20]
MLSLYALAIAALTQSDAATACPVDPAQYLAMPLEVFDQDLSSGWRGLERQGCTAQAADLLAAYRRGHRQLTDRERSILSWHEGQVRAMVGDSRRAIPLMMGGVQDDGGVIDFVDYALGTIAFLQRDYPGLQAARARLAAFPKPAGFKDTATVMHEGKALTVHITWPPNLDVLDRLIRC